jgi:type III pantothenate kinase
MLLGINANNTNFTFALFEGSELRGEWRIQSSGERTADEYGVWLGQLLEMRGLSFAAVTGAIIASVVPQALFPLKLFCRRYCNAEPLVVGDATVELGVKALVDNPREVGADRLVNAVGAHALVAGDLIVVDFGTATTFDVVDSEGNYRGGAIAPGIHLSLQALHLGTAQLPRVAIARPERIIGTDTVACMQSGVYWGYVGLIEGLIARTKREWNRPMTVIATGGLASLFADATDVFQKLVPDLTIRGLYEIYRRNRKLKP